MLKKLIALLIILSFSIENIGIDYTLYVVRQAHHSSNYPERNRGAKPATLSKGTLRPMAVQVSSDDRLEDALDMFMPYLKKEFKKSPLSVDIIARMLKIKKFDQQFVNDLIDIMLDDSTDWDVRKIASMALEYQVYLVQGSVSDISKELIDILIRFNIIERNEKEELSLVDTQNLQREGYSAGQVKRFINELIYFISINVKYFDGLFNNDSGVEGLKDFVSLAMQDDAHILLRYAVKGSEIVSVLSRKSQQTAKYDQATVDRYLQAYNPLLFQVIDKLPLLERQIFDALTASSEVHLVSSETPAQLSYLVWHPFEYSGFNPERSQETRVILIRAPGTSKEFEIKGTGLYGIHPITIGYRDSYTGQIASSNTHLWCGGGDIDFALFEFEKGLQLTQFWQRIHGKLPFLAIPVAVWKFNTIRVRGKDILAEDYFSNPKYWTEDEYKKLKINARAVAKKYLSAYNKSWTYKRIIKELVNNHRLTQLMYVGTSGYRFRIYKKYLSDKGPEIYFRETRQSFYSPEDSRRMVDTLLRKLMGFFDRPNKSFISPSKYKSEVLKLPKNRSQATCIYLDLMEQLGNHWGTILGLGGNTGGYGLHERNVAIEPVKESGKWRVRLIFHDLDTYDNPGKTSKAFNPVDFLNGLRKDMRMLFSLHGLNLDEIYEVDNATKTKGWDIFKKAMQTAFMKTFSKLTASHQLDDLVSNEYIDSFRVWLELVHDYLKFKPKAGHFVAEWKHRAREKIIAYGVLSRGNIDKYINSIISEDTLLAECSFIFGVESLSLTPAMFLNMLKNNEVLTEKLLSAKGLNIEHISEETGLGVLYLTDVIHFFVKIGLMAETYDEMNYAFTDMLKGPNTQYTVTLLGAISSLNYEDSEGVRVKLFHQQITHQDLNSQKAMEINKAIRLFIMRIMRQLITFPSKRGSVFWYVFDHRLFNAQVLDDFRKQFNNKAKGSEGIWIINQAEDVVSAIRTIHKRNPNAEIAVALHDLSEIGRLPVYRKGGNVRFMVFKGKADNILEVESVFSGLHTLFLQKQRIVANLKRVYCILHNNHQISEALKGLSFNSSRDFARQFSFYIKENTGGTDSITHKKSIPLLHGIIDAIAASA
jgi:hypothetical protein